MEQAQFRVKFPLGTKLVLSVSLLIAALIGFLSYSAVMLVVEDKQAYTYQLQSMEAYVASRDFSEKSRLALDNLRLYLSAFDPRQPVTPSQTRAIQAIVDNQSEAAVFSSYLVKPDGSVRPLTQTPNAEVAEKISLIPSKIRMDEKFFAGLYPTLVRDSFAFENVNLPGLPPLMVVAYADVGLKDYAEGMPVGIAMLDLSVFKQGRRFGEIVIARPDGTVLYSSDADLLAKRGNVKGRELFEAASVAKTQAGTKEFRTGNTRFLGAFQKTSLGTIVMTEVEWKKAMAAAYTLAERFILLGLISVTVAILFAIFFANTITRPLKRLFRATSQVSQGDFNIDPQVTTRDEVGQLSSSFVTMSKKIQELLIESIHKAQMQEELKVAAAVQESLIPPPEYRDGQVELIGHYQSANECGGDWWGFFRVGQKLCIMIGDATGHGVPSALITASARSCFSVLHRLSREKTGFRLAPAEMMAYANKVVFDAATTKIMMTFFIGVIDLDLCTLTYSNAGHNPPWLFKRAQDRFALKSLMARGNRLGEAEEDTTFEEKTLPIEPGDILVLYTDGLLENKNLQGEMYGKKRAKNIMEANLTDGPMGVIAALVSDYRAYGDGKALDDDVTLAAMRILPTATA